MTEHFTRNTESLRCWCYSCNDMTDHAVTDGNIGRCKNDHTKARRSAPRQTLQQFQLADDDPEIIVGNAEAPREKLAVSIKELRHIEALDGYGGPGRK
jgi:hypothetical protein